jgi:hypothetical protein
MLITLSAQTTLAQKSPSYAKHVKVYFEKGRFGGWPANHGMWNWGNEIVFGYSRGYYKDLGERHHIDREKPEEWWFARSLDGGEHWSLEHPATRGKIIPYGDVLHGTETEGYKPEEVTDCPGGINFTHPDFCMTLRMTSINDGESRFYYSYSRGRDWEGPYRLPNFGQPGTAARTDYIVNSKNDCMIFITAAKQNREEGRPLCAQTTDGGKTWELLSLIGDEPDGFSIMPSSIRLDENRILTTTRRREGDHRWIDSYLSNDNGKTWQFYNNPVEDVGIGNPPCLIKLEDGSLCLTYGVRKEPFRIEAKVSRDEGKTWGEPIVLRDDGRDRDIGYVRSIQRPDGKIVTAYYMSDQENPERFVGVTIWQP